MPDSIVADPVVDTTVACLMSGEVFTGLLDDRADERAVRLDSVLRRFVDESTRVAWVGNPLRSALTIERFLLQVAGPEVDLRLERSPAELAHLIAKRSGQETRLLIVVQQPETINPETRELLGAIAGHLGGEVVQVQFLFAGSRALRLPEVPPTGMAPLLPILPGAPAVELVADVPAGSRRRDVLPLALLLMMVVIGVVVSLWPPEQVLDVPTARALDPAPTRAGESPAARDIASEASRSVGNGQATNTAELRRQFELFLAARDAMPTLSAAQKDALFNEFLTYHRRE